MRNRQASLALLLLAGASPVAVSGDAHPLPAEPAHTAAITPEEYLWQDAWLSDDARNGREAGTPDCHAAALWIAGRMEKMGLESLDRAPGHLQPWILPGGVPDAPGCAFSILREGREPRPFAMEKEFVVMGGSGVGEFEGPVVFAGYGIKAPENKYDDFEGLDCKGKVVVVLRHEPREKDGKSRWNGDRMTRHSFFPFKVKNARDAGAAAVVIVNDLLNHEQDPMDAGSLGIPGDVGIPVVLASRAFTAELLAGTEVTPEGLQRTIDDADAPASREITGIRVRVKTALKKLPTENVVGVFRGSDPKLKDEWVIVGAHYDHVGRGYGGGLDPRRYGEIHNGADDNASGSAAMLEIAESFALGGLKTRRSLLFLSFSGEEKGLLGSVHFAGDSLVPLDAVVGMVNLDMVGRYRPGQFDVVGADSGTTLRATAVKAAEGLDLELNFTNSGMANSDGFSFYAKKVPTLFLFTGLHDDYHRPGDDWWLVNAEGAARVSTMGARIARALADDDGRPEYRDLPAGEFAMNRRNRVVLGVVLDEGGDGKGAGIQEISARSPAETAGMKAGDRLTSFGGRDVKNADDLRAALNYVRPGDEAKARVVRGDATLDLKVLFPGPPGPVFGVVYDAGDDAGRGALVQEVAAGSVAEACGLKPGDRVFSFAGREVPGGSSMAAALRASRAGETAVVKVLREGKEIELQAKFPR